MAMVTMTMEEIKKIMTPERRKRELEAMKRHPIVIDEDCPEITPDLVGKRFIPINRKSKATAV